MTPAIQKLCEPLRGEQIGRVPGAARHSSRAPRRDRRRRRRPRSRRAARGGRHRAPRRRTVQRAARQRVHAQNARRRRADRSKAGRAASVSDRSRSRRTDQRASAALCEGRRRARADAAPLPGCVTSRPDSRARDRRRRNRRPPVQSRGSCPPIEQRDAARRAVGDVERARAVHDGDGAAARADRLRPARRRVGVERAVERVDEDLRRLPVEHEQALVATRGSSSATATLAGAPSVRGCAATVVAKLGSTTPLAENFCTRPPLQRAVVRPPYRDRRRRRCRADRRRDPTAAAKLPARSSMRSRRAEHAAKLARVEIEDLHAAVAAVGDPERMARTDDDAARRVELAGRAAAAAEAAEGRELPSHPSMRTIVCRTGSATYRLPHSSAPMPSGRRGRQRRNRIGELSSSEGTRASASDPSSPICIPLSSNRGQPRSRPR